MPANAKLPGRVVGAAPLEDGNLPAWAYSLTREWKNQSVPLHAFIAAQITIQSPAWSKLPLIEEPCRAILGAPRAKVDASLRLMDDQYSWGGDGCPSAGWSLVPAGRYRYRWWLVLQTEVDSGQFDIGVLGDQVGYSLGIASDAEILSGVRELWGRLGRSVLRLEWGSEETSTPLPTTLRIG